MRKFYFSSAKTNLIVLVFILLAPLMLHAEQVIIRTAKPYNEMIRTIRRGGGNVVYQYRYVDALAADVAPATLKALQKQLPPGSVQKDWIVDLPRLEQDPRGMPLVADAQADSVESLDAEGLAALTDAAPNAYLLNNTMMNMDTVQGQGYYGEGVKVAVIDTGLRPGFPHIELDGSVIGGEDLVGDGMGYSNFANDGHGTFVAGMISANVVFNFSPTSIFPTAIRSYCPGCVIVGDIDDPIKVPMVGSAPLSSIYAIRIIPPGAGTPMSRILAAMERVVTLRENYDLGMPEIQNPDGSYDALNIRVCNMSVGGSTTYPGHDILDEMTQEVLDHDIVLVISAGNAGPSGFTEGSPATGTGSLTVGASSSAVHERILRDLQYGPGVGSLFRPFNGTETAYFSSRGPIPDGRIGPDLVANGMASFGQGTGSGIGSISINSGTSFSAPSVAGVAAVLREAVPGASAQQIRNALIMEANPDLLEDGSGPLDRGAGYVDGEAALELLQAGEAPDSPGLEGGTNTNVSVNLRQGANIETYSGNITRMASDLLPGQRFETFYRITPNTLAVVVILSDVTPGSPQNSVFGDDILLGIHSAKFTAVGEGDYEHFKFTAGGTFVVVKPELGLMRITLCGDWTNASPIAATVNIFSVYESTPQTTIKGRVADGDMLALPFVIPAGTSTLSARLEWQKDWTSYPANDIDLYLINPDGKMIIAGATLDSPEMVELYDPLPGEWTAIIDGYAVFNQEDSYKLRIMLDGKILR